MEKTRYNLNRIRDELDYYLVGTPTAELSRGRLQEFFDRRGGDVGRREPPVGRVPPPGPAAAVARHPVLTDSFRARRRSVQR